jgi:hypothetical protein
MSLWRSSLNILFIHRSVLLWRQQDNKSDTVAGNPLESKMRQISLGINQSCSNRLRVQIIPQLYSNYFIFTFSLSFSRLQLRVETKMLFWKCNPLEHDRI